MEQEKEDMEILSDYQKAQKWLEVYDWDNEPNADDNLATICEALQEIEKYKDLEEQGKLLVLPCAVGDIVWDNNFGQPCSYTVTGFSFGKIDDEEENDIEGLQIYYRNWNGSIRCSCAVSEIGKTVFLTKEQAEAALREMYLYSVLPERCD